MGCTRFLTGLAFFLQFAAAVSFMVIVIVKLDHYSFNVSSPTINGMNISLPNLTTDSFCTLGYTSSGGSLCVGSYIVAGISLAASLCLSLFLCLTCNLCGLGRVIDAIFAGVACALWSVWASVLVKNQHPNAPMQDWCTAVIALAISCAGLFGIACIFSICIFFKSCCCGGGSKSRDVENARPAEAYKMQSSPQQQFMYGSAPPPVVVVPANNSRW